MYRIQHILFSGFGRKQKIPCTSCSGILLRSVADYLHDPVLGDPSTKSLAACGSPGLFCFLPSALKDIDYVQDSAHFIFRLWAKTKNPMHFVLRDFIEVGGGFEPP